MRILKCQKEKLSLKAVPKGTLHFFPMHTLPVQNSPSLHAPAPGNVLKGAAHSPLLLQTQSRLSLLLLQPPMAEVWLQPAPGGAGQVQPWLAEGGEACRAKAAPVPQAPRSRAFPTRRHGLSCPACPGCYMPGQQWPCPV